VGGGQTNSIWLESSAGLAANECFSDIFLKMATIIHQTEGCARFKMTTKWRVCTGQEASKALIVEHNNNACVGKNGNHLTPPHHHHGGSLWKSPHLILC